MGTHDKVSVGSRITTRLEEFVGALKDRGNALPEQFTCRTVVLNIELEVFDAPQVLATRRLLGASQTIFAQFLGVSPNTVRAWEQGAKSPKDMACRFLDEIRRNPDYWRARLRDSVRLRDASASL